MKSLVRLGAILGIVGCTLLGPSPIANKMSALALPVPQVVEKLRPVPVFTITDDRDAFFITSVPKQGQGQTGNASVARIFISQKDAQAFVDQLKTANSQLAASARVTPVSLGEIYRLAQENKGKPDQVLFAFIPAAQQVQSAKTVLQQTGQQVSELNGVPLFVARGGPENGYLTIQRGGKEELPLFFNKEDLQEMIERFKQQQPNVTATIKIEVVNLERILEALGTENDPSLSQMILIPSRESIEYVRSRQPAGAGQNQQPAASPAPARPAASPAPARPAPAPARPAR
ncbi:Tic22 family protein [Microcoleus sp. CAWBG58]|uniref:Tic22 family protein n=1 Tax=Microcoleus sp. CAWBG58 TaxID=2841651 RepID=UPI0025D102F1|nr:Tic22 family protein [Microcoleus sp. CAWBG58]